MSSKDTISLEAKDENSLIFKSELTGILVTKPIGETRFAMLLDLQFLQEKCIIAEELCS